ncbi:MAG: tRNA methyl transferase PRC-barrel domain-containing protein [candidate division WOR-3 bacterium]|nr:tRNA methyl transferase PRC-barrel domain-containing protein [candidate division WOR-3 bacterium]
MSNRVIVGYSGGIDSTAVAVDLMEQGYDVIPVTLILTEGGTVKRKALNGADRLGLEPVLIDRRELFKKRIMDYFARAYAEGMTPNPCAMCNRLIKFPLLRQFALENAGGRFTTGHYVQIRDRHIYKAADRNKDQSYFLSTVQKSDLIGFVNTRNAKVSKRDNIEFLKEREIVMDYSDESQEICFIKDDYTDFLKKHYDFSNKKGAFVDTSNNIIGSHNGYFHFTVGQRKGLKRSFNRRMYVKDIDAANNRIMLAPRDQMLFAGLEMSIIEEFDDKEYENLTVKIRYRHRGTGVKHIQCIAGQCRMLFDEPAAFVSPGQIAVVYHKDRVVMSGIIIEKINEEAV